MRPNQQKYAVSTSSSQASVKMSFDEGSVAFLMDALTNLYSDPVTAPIREIISNAIDSHVEAGQTRPVEVTRPSTFRPVFEVRDFGVGMNVDTLLKVYGKYGYSTKRHTNDQIGMMGLGSKAALTYTDSFSVIAVKDGVRIFAVVSRGQDGGGGVDVKDTSRVDEPDGVIVQVPVSQVTEFNRKLNRFVRYAVPGTMLVDGNEPSAMQDAFMKVSDRLYLVNHWTLDHDDRDILVSGGVPYDAGNHLSRDTPYGYSVVAFVDIGDVDMPPNRESLHYTDKTNAATERIRGDIKLKLREAAQAAVDGAKNHTEAITVSQKWSNLAKDLTYRGQKIPTRYSVSTEPHISFSARAARNAVSTGKTTYLGDIPNTLIITGYENVSLSGVNRTKIRKYIESKGLELYKVALIAGDEFMSPWDEGSPRVEWSEIKAIKLPRNTNPKRNSNGTVRYNKGGGWLTVGYEDVPSKEIILVTPPQTKPENSRTSLVLDVGLLVSSLLSGLPDMVAVVLEKNRHDKFKRHYPNAKFYDLRQALTLTRKNFFDTLSDNEYRLIFDGETCAQLRFLDESKIADPDVVEAIKLSKTNIDAKKQEWARIQRQHRSQENFWADPIRRELPAVKNVLDVYPLARYTDRSTAAEVARYINAMYTEES